MIGGRQHNLHSKNILIDWLGKVDHGISVYLFEIHIFIVIQCYLEGAVATPGRRPDSIDNFCTLDPIQKPINTLTKRKI